MADLEERVEDLEAGQKTARFLANSRAARTIQNLAPRLAKMVVRILDQ